MDAQFYADWWKQMFEWSPHLDLIAPQDSMGANGNSFSNVSEYLSELAQASRAAGRDVWSNVELCECRNDQLGPLNVAATLTHGLCEQSRCGHATAPARGSTAKVGTRRQWSASSSRWPTSTTRCRC